MHKMIGLEMNEKTMLVEAKCQFDCIFEALVELEIGDPDVIRKAVIQDELFARALAGSYLVGAAIDPSQKPDDFNEIISAANAFDSWGK